MNEVYDFLKKCGTYFLATDEGGQPRVRPFGTIDLFEDKLWIQTGKSKKVADQLKANPKIEICAMDGDEWLRVSAEVVLDTRIEPQKHMLDAYPELQAMYKPGDGNTEVYYLKNVVAQLCTFGAKPVIFRF